MTFSLEQILTDPELKCPKGDVRVQIPTPTMTYYVALHHKLADLLNKAQIKYTYHGSGLFTIHNP